MNPTPPNPLIDLIRALHLSPAGLAATLGIEPAAVRAALATKPSRSIDAICRFWAALQVLPARLTVAPEPVRFNVDLARADALFCDQAFRRAHGLLALPANVGELRRLVRGVSRRVRSSERIARRLEQSFIPTARGLATWRRSTVGQILRGGHTGASSPVEPGPELVDRWREFVLGVITSSACPPDPAAIARYAYQSSRVGNVITYHSTRPMPACVAQWTRAGLEAMGARFGIEVGQS